MDDEEFPLYNKVIEEGIRLPYGIDRCEIKNSEKISKINFPKFLIDNRLNQQPLSPISKRKHSPANHGYPIIFDALATIPYYVGYFVRSIKNYNQSKKRAEKVLQPLREL